MEQILSARRIDVGILGATGVVGQQFIKLLADHPWFNLRWLAASERSAGRLYRNASTWRLSTACPEPIASLLLDPCEPGIGPQVVFSALDATAASVIEPAFAAAGHIVVSNARTLRMDPVVPLLIPEVNPDHLAIIGRQKRERGWRGAVVVNPNCSAVVLAMVLAPLRQFGLRSAVVTTLQALSGAGYPGVSSLDATANVIPAIEGEEEKIESETQKTLGKFDGHQVSAHPIVVTAHTTRVPVVDGHTETISIEFDSHTPAPSEMQEALTTWRPRPQELRLPSAPARPIEVAVESNRPQPRLDAERGRGMTVTVGRIRSCPVLGLKCVALGHNTIRGAAGAAILNAELMHAESRLP